MRRWLGGGRVGWLWPAAAVLAIVGLLGACAGGGLERRTGDAGSAIADISPDAAAPGETSGTGASPRGDDAPVIRQGPVVDVVDGDTIDLADGTRIRLAMVAAPEIHGGVEPCGPEANDLAGRLLAGQTVAIYRPVDAPQTDRYGRTLGEVVRVSDGRSLNVALVASGLAGYDHRFADEDPDLARRLRAAADEAPRPDCRVS